MPKKRPLTDKQKLFAQEYCVDFSPKEAAIRAGYSKNGAEVAAHNLLKNERIVAIVKKYKDSLEIRQEVDKNFLLKECTELLTRVKGKEDDEMTLKTLQYIGRVIGVEADIKLNQVNINNVTEAPPQDIEPELMEKMCKQFIIEQEMMRKSESEIIDVEPNPATNTQ